MASEKIAVDQGFIASYYKHANGAIVHRVSQLMNVYVLSAELGKEVMMRQARHDIEAIFVEQEFVCNPLVR